MPGQIDDSRIRSDRYEAFLYIEAQLRPIAYGLIAIASVVAAILRADISWYHPLPAAILIFIARFRREQFQEMMVAARIHEYEPTKLGPYGDTKRMQAAISSVRHRAEKAIGGLCFKEMFESPATVSAWLAAGTIGVLAIGVNVALIAWCVLGRITSLQMFGTVVGSLILIAPLKRLRVNAAFKKATRRWTAQHLAELEANPEARSALVAANGITLDQLPNWLTMEIIRLYFAGVHPDHFHFTGDQPHLETRGPHQQDLA
jgi:hypothetical protein